MTEPIVNPLTDSRAAVPASPQGNTEGGERGINRYLYENLVSNVESQIEYWTQKADRDSNAESSHALRLKAEGLGYTLRLLHTFEPEFRELVEMAQRGKCNGCEADLSYKGYGQATSSSLCDACYELGRDEQTFIAENAANFDWLRGFAAE